MLCEQLGETKQLVKQREMLCLLCILRNDSSLRLQGCGYGNTFNSTFHRLNSDCMLGKSSKHLQTQSQEKIKPAEISFLEKSILKESF